MTSELKPCPFCGRVPVRADDESDIYYIGHDVDCYIVSLGLFELLHNCLLDKGSSMGRAWERRDDE
jgi:hypothetical protein